jgi:hypothetical protein
MYPRVAILADRDEIKEHLVSHTSVRQMMRLRRRLLPAAFADVLCAN